jgi:magnesium-transporting ATPase (P-type)
MLELIMVLSAVLRNYTYLAVVSALLIVNAVLRFTQEQRAAGVVEALRKRLQVNARVFALLMNLTKVPLFRRLQIV